MVRPVATLPKYRVVTINNDGTEKAEVYKTLDAIVPVYGITKPCLCRMVNNKVKKFEDKPKGGRSKSRTWLINHRIEVIAKP